MGLTWDAVYSFFSPPASRNTSPQSSPSLFSSSFLSKPTDKTSSSTKQTDLPMPPTSASAAAMPSPAESSTSLAPSERDYFPPSSPNQQQRPRRPSVSSTTTSASSSSSSSERQQQPPAHQQRTTTAPTPSPQNDRGKEGDRQPAPRRSATDLRGPPEPLSRDFPKPSHEPSLDELLAREPGKWSLGHYVKHARVSPAAKRCEEDGEAERTRRLEEAKRELLRAKEEIDGLAAGRR